MKSRSPARLLLAALGVALTLGSLRGRAQAQVCGDPPIDDDGDGLADCIDQCVELPTEQCLSLPFFITVKTTSGSGQVACTFDGITIQCDELNGLAVVSPVTAQSECRSAHRPPGWEPPPRRLIDLGGGVRGWSDRTLAASCRVYLLGDANHLYQGFTGTGVYRIDPDGSGAGAPFDVWCDQTTAGGGWTVLQRRISASDFYQGWASYAAGFGDVATNYWLGNERIAAFTARFPSELRIDMTYNGQSYYAAYTTFSVGALATNYRLSIGSYSGNAGDSLAYHNNRPFSTFDADHDSWPGNCALSFLGAWWNGACTNSNLNGLWGASTYGQGLNWIAITGDYGSVTFSEMKMRER